jgi:uncharacterized damage-inducible protein DinB
VSGDVVSRLAPPEGFASVHVASTVAGVDELRERLVSVLRELTPAQLEWQPGPGANTIGMLAAHTAIAEVNFVQVGLLGEAAGHVEDVLGIGADDDGLPLPAGGGPPATLAGRDAAFFLDLLARAGAHTRAGARGVPEARLDEDVVRPPRPDGTRRIFTRRWILFHMLEHAAGHLGQVQALVRQLPPR